MTPGYLIADDEALTEAKLRLMAAPTVQIPPGAVSDTELNLPAVQEALGVSSRPNLFANGSFLEERWGAATVECLPDLDTWNAEEWCVRPTGGNVQYAKGTAVPPNALSLHGVRISGGSGVTVCQLAQRVDRSMSSTLQRKLTFSGWLYNNTGASHVPQVIVSTCNAPNDWENMTVELTRNLAPCPNSEWTAVAVVLDCTALPDIENGMRVALQWPAPSLDASGKTWDVAQLKLEVGEAATALPPDLEWSRRQCVGGQMGSMMIRNHTDNPTYQVEVAGRDVVLKDNRGLAILRDVAGTVDMTAAGFGGLDVGTAENSTWYYIFAVSDGSEAVLLASKSATAPTVPVGYPYRALIGVIYNKSDGNLKVSRQIDRRVFYELALNTDLVNLNVGTAGAWYTENISAYVPPIATMVHGNAGTRNSALSCGIVLAGSSAGLGQCYLLLSDTGGGLDNWSICAPFEVPVVTAQRLYYRSGATGNRHWIQVVGFGF